MESTETIDRNAQDLERITQAWSENRQVDFSETEARLIRAIYPNLAQGEPLSPERVSESSGFPLRLAQRTFRLMRRMGADFDAEGNLVGNALTLRPTPHKFTVDGQQLYAWCALDTLFLPGLVGGAAKIESTCLATGDPIRLSLSPNTIESVDPPKAVVSVAVPGVSAACAPDQGKGGNSAACQSMNFYVSREAAESHLGPNADVAILSVEEAWKLAQKVWVEPYLKALEPAS